MAILMIMNYGNYTNADAVENVIRYVTRTRKDEDRGNELIAWGGLGIGGYASPELAITQFKDVQRVYGIKEKGGRRIFHEVLRLLDVDFDMMFRDYDCVYQTAVKCAEAYYLMGHQVVFGIHHAKKEMQAGNCGVHIHFVVNTVNFVTGNKWHTSHRESAEREKLFNQKMWEVRNNAGIQPFDTDTYFLWELQ